MARRRRRRRRARARHRLALRAARGDAAAPALLLQHGLPGALAAAAALAARAPSLGGSERAAALASLEASVVCFGCLWQPGFAVHAPAARRHRRRCGCRARSGSSGTRACCQRELVARERRAVELPETPLAALLAALRAAAAVRGDAAASSAAWRATLNLLRIAAAAAALLAFAPAPGALPPIGRPRRPARAHRRAAGGGGGLGPGAAARRRALMTAAQAVAAVLQPAAAREAVVWHERLRAGGGVRGVGALVAFAIASAEVPSPPDGAGAADHRRRARAAPADAGERRRRTGGGRRSTARASR